MTNTTLFLNILAIGTLFASILTITSKNPVISVIFLISTFVQAALYLILYGINFVGIAYIVIYVGAIAVLFLFIIMMINIKLTDILDTGNQYNKNLPLAVGIGFLFIYVLLPIFILPMKKTSNLFNLVDISREVSYLLNDVDNHSNLITINNSVSSKSFSIYDEIITQFQQIEALGHGLYTHEASLLIIIGIILLLAMIAIIILSKDD